MNTFDWSLVSSFLAVLDSGSLLGAARRLGVSQPTVGRHVDALESQLGMPLFERTGRGMVPTPFAQRIAGEARLMQQGADRLATAAAGVPDEAGGLVRVSASRMMALYLLPPCIADLQAQQPSIDIALVSSDEVSNLLRREADIAIRMIRPAQSSLIARRIGDMSIVACASRDYLARRGTPRSAKDLAVHRLVGPDRSETEWQHYAGLARAVGLDPGQLQFGFRSDDFATQLAGVRAGLGVGFLLRPVVQHYDELVPLSLDMPLPAFPVWLVVHREIRGNARYRRVFDFLVSALAGYCR